MVFSAWLILKDPAAQDHIRISFVVEPLEIRTIRKFGTAHSSTSTRTNALLRVRLDTHESLSEVGLPPFKPGIYEGTYADCERLMKTYASLLVNAFGKQVVSWFNSESPAETFAWDSAHEAAGNSEIDFSSEGLSDMQQAYSKICYRLIEVLDFCMSEQEGYPRSAYTLLETGILKCMSFSLDVPISELLQISPGLESIKCFYTVGMSNDFDEMLENVRYGRDNTAFIKLKVDCDLSKALQAMRLLEGEGLLKDFCKTVAIDANCSWTPQVATKFLQEFKEYTKYVVMVEQPFPFDMPFSSGKDNEEWMQVKALFESEGVEIYADESMRTSHDVELLSPYCHGVNIKLEKTGGFREAVRAQKICQSLGIKVWLGCMVGSALNCNSIIEILQLCNSAADMDGFLLVSASCTNSTLSMLSMI